MHSLRDPSLRVLKYARLSVGSLGYQSSQASMANNSREDAAEWSMQINEVQRSFRNMVRILEAIQG